MSADWYAGRVAAVTGAGSGIGRALAVQLAAAGARVAISDVDEEGLAGTVDRCKAISAGAADVVADRVDVADRDAVAAWADRVAGEWGTVQVVVNNAGVAVASTVEAMSLDDLRWLMDINFWGVVHGIAAFLPHLIASGDGHLANLSSVFGLISVPSQGAYNASKFAVRGYSEALSMELRIDRRPVTVTTVHPGGIRTNIARNARINASVAAYAGDERSAREGFDRVARTSPERAATAILDGIAKGRRRVLIGADATVIDLLSRLPGSWYQGALVAGARLRRR